MEGAARFGRDDVLQPSPTGEVGALPGMNGGALPMPVKGACRVPSCTQRLLQPYNQRHRICRLHQKATAIEFEGLQWRFCQQCAKLQTTDCFAGDKRSCAASLQQQKERRQRQGGGARLGAGLSGGGADDGNQHAGEHGPRAKRRRCASLTLLQQLEEEGGEDEDGFGRMEEEEEEEEQEQEQEEEEAAPRQCRQQVRPWTAAAWAAAPPAPPAPAAPAGLPLEKWVQQQAQQAAQQQAQQQRQQQVQWPVRPAAQQAASLAPLAQQGRTPSGGLLDALLAVDGLSRRMERLESQVELILQLLQGQAPQLAAAVATPQAAMPPPPPQPQRQSPPAPQQQQQQQQRESPPPAPQQQQQQQFSLLASFGLPSGLLSLPLPVGAALNGETKQPQGDEPASMLMLRAAAELLQRSGGFPAGAASEQILTLAEELGLLPALQGGQAQKAAAQQAQQAAAQQALPLAVAQQGALPPRVRLPSPTIVRPPPATAAAASLCTRGLGHKPLVLGGSLAGSAAPAGSSNSGDLRPAGANSGRSANRSPVPNPFTAFTAGGSPEAPGHGLRQENGSNPVAPAGGPHDSQGLCSMSPALRVQQRVEGLQSLLRLMAGGSSG